MSRTVKATALLASGCISLFLLPACDGVEVEVEVDGIPVVSDSDAGYPNISWRLDKDEIRSRFEGEVLKALKSEDIAEKLEDIVDSANSQLATSVFASDGDNVIRTPTACDAKNCVSGDDQLRLSGLRVDATEYQSVMSLDGVSYAQSRVSEELANSAWSLIDRVGYTGWLRYSMFALSARNYFPGDRVDGASLIEGYAYSIGKASGSNPKDTDATWTGSMTGVAERKFDSFTTLVHGDVEISVDVSDETASVSFTNILDARRDVRHDDMSWDDLALVDGGFKASTIQGRFYGPNHKEVGGVFENNNIIGSFGATREE